MLRIALITIFFAKTFNVFSQTKEFSFNISYSSVGFITDETGFIIGTGFVFEKPNQVITCAHVIQKNKIFFRPVKPEKTSYLLHLKTTYEAEDIAILISDDTICKEPLKYGTSDKISPGDQIVYIGYNQNESNDKSIVLKAHRAELSACGLVKNGGSIARFFEFQGEGIPGYSGGPVFDVNGGVIAIFRQAWTVKGLKRGAPETLINRAFSITPISNSK